jgi:hypothetical protein
MSDQSLVTNIKWSDLVKFSDKQKAAAEAAYTHDFVLYGGAAGGGKSYWLRWWPIEWLIRVAYKQLGLKNVVFGLFCEDYPSLKDRHLTKMAVEIPPWLGEVKESTVYGLCLILNQEFGGGVIALRNLDDPSKYQSSEFAGIAVDELTKNPEETFSFLRSRMRWPGIEHTKFIAGTNPGSVGHNWVRKLWIDRKFPVQEEQSDQFVYVPAKAADNPHISKTYLSSLASLPEKQRKAFLEGDWNIFEGQFFTEFEPAAHVCEYFKIPASWAKIRTIDVSGRGGWTACLWLAIDTDKRVWVYREYYATGRDADEHARQIASLSVDENMMPEDYKYTVMDSSAWDKLGMPETFAEIYEREGVYGLVPSSKKRVMGWDSVHRYLRPRDENKGVPQMKFFAECSELIRTLPTLSHDKNVPDDVDCFVAGTMVLTPLGNKEIENIRVGELVVTPIGNKRVIKSGVSGDCDRVCSVYLSDGRILRGTANHKVMVKNKGLIELQELRASDILMERINSNIEYIWRIRQLFIGVLRILKEMAGSIMNPMEVIEKWVIRRFIDRFILIILGLYQVVITFTTKTITTITTNPPIWLQSQLLNTLFTTTKLIFLIQSKKEKDILGTDRYLEKKNCVNTQEKCLQIRHCEGYRAEIVEILLKLNILQSFVVNTVDGVRDFIRLCVSFVERVFYSKKTVSAPLEHVHIVAVGNYGKELVYRLTIEDSHLYYANGFLVTNTDGEDHLADALRYGLQTLRDQGVPRSETTVEKKLRMLKEATESGKTRFHYFREFV